MASYLGFAQRKEEADLYVSYQDKYRDEPKECERVAAGIIGERADLTKPNSLLDIGCSTGNFVRYLDAVLPGSWLFTGLDLMPQAIEKAKARQIAGAEFTTGDLFTTDLGEFDIITLMTVVYAFNDNELEDCFHACREALKPGGALVVFDLFHPWEGHYSIVERSHLHPDGHPLNMRPLSFVRKTAESAGLQVAEFRQFDIPKKLTKPYDPYDLTTYTVESAEGRLLFRGPLSQPFCHAVFIKP